MVQFQLLTPLFLNEFVLLKQSLVFVYWRFVDVAMVFLQLDNPHILYTKIKYPVLNIKCMTHFLMLCDIGKNRILAPSHKIYLNIRSVSLLKMLYVLTKHSQNTIQQYNRTL